MVLAVLAVNTASTGGLVVLAVNQGHARSAHVRSDAAVTGPMLQMEPFVIQLRRGASDNGERYLRVAFDLELRTEADRSAFNHYSARVNDALISYFSDHTVEELRGANGLMHVKEALFTQLEKVIPGHTPKTVYITDFLIQ
jgi:flagellar basal body-associated protein FliL